jgi:shikimate kinase
MSIIRGLGVFVYLSESADALFERIIKKGLPAFLSPHNPAADFRALYARRDPLYRKAAHVIVELNGAGPEESYSLLTNAINEYCHAR